MSDNQDADETSAAEAPPETHNDAPPHAAAEAEPAPVTPPEPPAAEPESGAESAPQEIHATPKETHKETHKPEPPHVETHHKEKKIDIIEMKQKRGTAKDSHNQDEDVVGMLQGFFGEGITTEEKTVKPIRRPKLMFFNSYKLESKKPFSSEKVTNVIKKTTEEMLDKVKYKSATATDLCVQVAEKIRGRVIALKFDRYKFVVHASIGPLNRQGEHIGFRGFWDGKRDSYAFYTYKNARIFCNVIVCGFYFE